MTKRKSRLPSKYQDYELYTAYCLHVGKEDPKDFEEAVKSKEWRKAIDEEIEAHEKFGTWEPGILSENKKPIDTKWIFKTKQDGIKKARLVANGF
nr:unnamed protein product [Callosobruchus analis]